VIIPKTHRTTIGNKHRVQHKAKRKEKIGKDEGGIALTLTGSVQGILILSESCAHNRKVKRTTKNQSDLVLCGLGPQAKKPRSQALNGPGQTRPTTGPEWAFGLAHHIESQSQAVKPWPDCKFEFDCTKGVWVRVRGCG
jgi:hypothetical protein